MTDSPATLNRSGRLGQPIGSSTRPQPVAEAQPFLVWHALPDGRVTYVNSAWCSFTGLSAAESAGRGWERAVHPEDLQAWRVTAATRNRSGDSYELEYRLRRADSAFHWILGHAGAVHDGQDQLVAWVGTGIVLDEAAASARAPAATAPLVAGVAAQWLRERAAPAVLRQQGTMVAVAAHDMKNQIGVIRGVAQLAERHLQRGPAPDPARLLRDLGTIQRSTRKLQRQVDELLDLTRLQIGQAVEFNRGQTDLVALSRDCVAEYALTTVHALTFLAADEVLIGMWDAPRLERVLANLLTNAIKYSAPGGAIHVTLGQDPAGEQAVLVVQDTGVGVPAADLPHLFTPFYRGRNVVLRTAGTGIGLFGARAIVEQHGGTLQLESTETVGTTVTVRLPLRAEQ